jgi:large subunit ribosomal protein L22
MAKNIRERAKKRSNEEVKQANATASFVRTAPSKVGIVLDIIRNKSVKEAQAILQVTPNAAAREIIKVLNSAVSNAENNLSLNKDDLVIKECYVGHGPTFKRMIPKAKGRGDRILKRTSHITVVLDTAK